MGILTYLIIAGLVQGHILGLYLFFSKKGNIKANKILGILILSFSTSSSHFVFYPSGTYEKFPHLLLVFMPLIFAYGPLFLFYERTLTMKEYVINHRKWLHFFPLIVCVALFSPFYIKSGSFKLFFLVNNNYTQLVNIARHIEILHLVQIMIYLFIIKNDLKKYHSKILGSFSSIEEINLNWLKLLVQLFIIVYSFVVVVEVVEFMGFIQIALTYGMQIIGALISLCVYIVGYRGMVQPEIFVTFYQVGQEQKPLTSDAQKVFDKGEMAALVNYMQEKKPYLKEDLTLTELAEQLGMSRNQLSTLINSGSGQNFYMFINKYRVEEVKALLMNPAKKHYTILGIAFESGFNSKSSFHNIFKKFTGLTPIEYRSSLEPDGGE